MKHIFTLTILLFSLSFQNTSAQTLPQPSPMSKIYQKVGLTDINIIYSRPGVKGRTIFGDLVPYDKLWRTGANSATLLEVSHDITINETKVPMGSYAILTIPGEKEWTVIINKDDKLRGTGSYDEAKDLMRFKVKSEAAPFRERMAFDIEDMTDEAATIRLHWDKTAISFKIGVETAAMAEANIEEAIKEREAAMNNHRVYSRAAQYCLNSSKDYKKGLEYIAKALEVEDYWWSHRVKAQLLAANGDKKGAIKEAEVARKMGAENYAADGKDFEYYNNLLDKDIAGYK